MAGTWMEGAGTRSAGRRVACKNCKRETSLLLVVAILPLVLLNACAGVVSASKTQPVSQASFQVTPANISFGNVPVGKVTSQNLSISNTGNSAVNITQASFSNSQFSLSGMTTPMALATGQAVTFSVSVNPTSAGAITGTLTVQGDGGSLPAVVNLSATGVTSQPQLRITPSSFSFGNVAVGTTDSQTIQLSNTGTAALTVSQVSVAGSAFSTSGLTLPLTFSPGQTSTFNVQFSPVSAGSASGSLTITSNAPGSPVTMALAGTGMATTLTLRLSSNSLSFGNVNTGSSATQTETVTNTGNATVQITQISISGSGYSLTGAGTPVGLSAGQALTFSIIFSPTNAGSATGTVTVTSNATGSPASIALSGTGVMTPTAYSVALTWDASTSTVVGYYVYRSTTNGAGYAKITGSSIANLAYTDSAVQDGMTYYYVTTAVDSSGAESSYSNQAVAVIP
jgi:hypothetical protein